MTKLAGTAIVLGIVALVVPAFIALTVRFVAPAACVIEQAGPIASLKRSAQLKKGHRWKIFAVAFLLVIMQSASAVPAFLNTSLGFVAVWIWEPPYSPWQTCLGASSIMTSVLPRSLVRRT